MKTQLEIVQANDGLEWDNYVYSHPQSTHYQLFGWRSVIEETYGIKGYYLMALKKRSDPPKSEKDSKPVAAGILPLFHLKKVFNGDRLVSIPFFDVGGILADCTETGEVLLAEAILLGKSLGVEYLELRQSSALKCVNSDIEYLSQETGFRYFLDCPYQILSYKVGLERILPDSAGTLMKSFPSKLRNQIKKPLKNGLTTTVGAEESVNDFYSVLARNMRDLGSPVHSQGLFINILRQFPDDIKIVTVQMNRGTVAGSLVVKYRDTLKNPWSSSLREYRYLAPNMLLYWTMLEYACHQGFTYFDFGRSSPEAGTCKFKLQWGAKASPLYWYFFALNGVFKSPLKESLSFELWKKLPVPVSKFIGPAIRKRISL